jgi:hypothetical protein
MTTTEIMHDKKVLGTEKVDASIKAPVDKFGKTHESSDIINMEKAKFDADKVSGSAKKLDAALREPADNVIKAHSEPSDMVNKDNARIEADKVAGTAKDAHLKAAVETKNQSGTVKDRS